MSSVGTTVSRHWFRRSARKMRLRLERQHPGHRFGVEKARRGPYLWAVVEYKDKP